MDKTDIPSMSELIFQKSSTLTKDKTLQTMLEFYETEPNKKKIKYVYIFHDNSWCLIEGNSSFFSS